MLTCSFSLPGFGLVADRVALLFRGWAVTWEATFLKRSKNAFVLTCSFSLPGFGLVADRVALLFRGWAVTWEATFLNTSVFLLVHTTH